MCHGTFKASKTEENVTRRGSLNIFWVSRRGVWQCLIQCAGVLTEAGSLLIVWALWGDWGLMWISRFILCIQKLLKLYQLLERKGPQNQDHLRFDHPYVEVVDRDGRNSEKCAIFIINIVILICSSSNWSKCVKVCQSG